MEQRLRKNFSGVHKFLVRLYKNLNHGSCDYESNLKKIKEVEQELRDFYSSYDVIKYVHMDIEFFCSQNMMPVAIPFKTILSFDEAGVGFLPMSFLDEASKIQVGKKELNVFVAKTACKRSAGFVRFGRSLSNCNRITNTVRSKIYSEKLLNFLKK